MINIKIRDRKTEKALEKVKEIEEIKCNTKALAFLLQCYEEKIKIEVELSKTRKAG